MNRKGNALIIGIIIGMVVMAAIGGAYYLGIQKNTSATNTVQPQLPSGTVNKNVSPSPSVQPVNLKTYKSSRYGFAFQYPSEWSLSEEPGIVNTSETNVLLKIQDKEVLGIYAAIPPMGCGPVDESSVTKSTFQIGTTTIEAENFCGEKTSFILQMLNDDNKEIDVWVQFVTTPQEELGRDVLKSITGLKFK